MRLERIDDVATIVLHDPPTRNALSFALFHELGAALEQIESDPAMRFVVIRGSGGVFSSGANLSDLASKMDAGYVEDYWRRMSATVTRLRNMPQIVISAIDGPAIGAGAALALAGDIVAVTPDTRFRWSFSRLGLVPDAGTALVLSQALGTPKCRDLLLTGRWMDAREAWEAGLVARIVPSDEFERAVSDILAELRESPRHALALTKHMIENAALPAMASAVRNDGIYQLAATVSGDYRDRLSPTSRQRTNEVKSPTKD